MKTAVRVRLRLIAQILSVVPVLAVLAAGWFWWRLHQSLPMLDGSRTLQGLVGRVTVDRDALGVPTVHAANRLDLVRTQGWLHAQDRFFQMDLLRRRGAGELAALFGANLVSLDKAARVHQFRKVAQEAVARLSEDKRLLLAAYAAGVNSGLEALRYKPFEYIVLRSQPERWKEEDSFLVMFAMWLDLQDSTGQREQTLATLRDTFGSAALEFFAPSGSSWDAALDGSTLPISKLPGPELIDFRKSKETTSVFPRSATNEKLFLGSNAFAVAGSHTKSGSAVVANDMHLGLGLPNVWYRVSFETGEFRATGVTLPGMPGIVAGSNGHVAWGFTDAYADTTDLVVVEADSKFPESYRVLDRWTDMKVERETIAVRGGASQILEVRKTIWGPIIGTSSDHRPYALHWVAHDPSASNIELVSMIEAKTTEDAIAIAHRVGIPAENIIIGDAAGHIAWTLAGKIPKRVGYTGTLPISWAYGDRSWSGYLMPEETPVIRDPSDGKLWSANSRAIGGPDLKKLGDAGYDIGARSRQIRDDLVALLDKKTEGVVPQDLLTIQLDDRAVFLARWRDLMLTVLKNGEPVLAEMSRSVEAWGGQASVGSAGYRLVRDFRLAVLERSLRPVVTRTREISEAFDYDLPAEDVVWRMISEKPPHLLGPEFKTWEELLHACANDVMISVKRSGLRLDDFTWGKENIAAIRHPFAQFLPDYFAGWLSMTPDPLPGDNNMPRVQEPSVGASERFSVMPGHEDQSVFEMPGGQSGHPLSPFFAAGHFAWVKGEPSPFLPGKSIHTLTLTP